MMTSVNEITIFCINLFPFYNEKNFGSIIFYEWIIFLGIDLHTFLCYWRNKNKIRRRFETQEQMDFDWNKKDDVLVA